MDECRKRGIEKLKSRVKSGEIVCFTTDKSGRWAVDTPDNYRAACEVHLNDEEKTPRIDVEVNDKGEKQMNCEALALLRMMGNEEGDKGKRLRNAVVAHGVKVPPFYGTRKDHKELPEGEEERGPKVRPVCGAEDCKTKRVSFLLCKLCSPLIKGNPTHCDSTAKMLESIEAVNREGLVNENVVVGSLDVDALYPSLNIDRCAEVVRRRMFMSDLDFENLRWKEIGLYLVYHFTEEELRKEKVFSVCPKRRSRHGAPTFTANGSEPKEEDRHRLWKFPRNEPSKAKVRYMFCLAIKAMIKTTMSLHDFHFEGRIYRQTSGGSIGLDLTGVLSDIYMCDWDEHLLRKCKNNNVDILMYQRYKDDVDVAVDTSNNDMLKRMENRDIEVMNVLKQYADSIDENLKVSTDCCSKNEDSKVPNLDVKMWVGQTEEGEWKILHKHYMKDVASRALMDEKSSHSYTMKKNVFVNEVDRIFRNTSPHLKWEEYAAPSVSYFMKRMKYSGYSKMFRHEILREALKLYDTRIMRHTDGRSYYRKEEEEGDEKKAESKYEWYKCDGKFESVMFVEATPNSELKMKMKQLVKKHKMKINIVEKVGETMKTVLQRSDPFGSKICGRNDCFICNQGLPLNCRERGCVYELTCLECVNKHYRGQTSRAVYDRTKEHIKDWNDKSENSPLHRHSEIYHNGEKFEISIRLLAKCFGKASRRLIAESVYISELKEEETMNSRHEWSYFPLDML